MKGSSHQSQSLGTHSKSFDRVDALMNQGVRRQTFPGAVLLVAVGDRVMFHKAYGMADLFGRHPMTCDTFFDLASLTKPLATAAACMILAQQDRLALDRPCAHILPLVFVADKNKITPRHLLSHCSGLPAWRPYYMHLQHLEIAERSLALTQLIQAEALSFLPGEKDDYSDLGFILLQQLIEEISGKPMDRFLKEALYGKLGLESLFFVDLDGSAMARKQFAATELCPWRNRLLRGQVHDDNAFVMGGVAGHAGLFGTARAVFDLLRVLMRADREDTGQNVFDPVVVSTFFQRQGSHRYALGFDTPSARDSSAGKHFPEDSVGHLGYTGTSFWVHRSQQVAVVLLTNRVHPSRYNLGIRAFRPQLHNLIMEEITR